jgi:hypothetical protein
LGNLWVQLGGVLLQCLAFLCAVNEQGEHKVSPTSIFSCSADV